MSSMGPHTAAGGLWLNAPLASVVGTPTPRVSRRLLLGVGLLGLAASPLSACRLGGGEATLHVDPRSGDDARDGSSSADAVRSIARAVLLLKHRRNADPISVVLHDGLHPITDKVILTGITSPVRWVAASGARPVISGGRPLPAWKERYLGELRIWTAPNDSGRYFRSLYVDDRRRPRPVWPQSAQQLLDTSQPVGDRVEGLHFFAAGTHNEDRTVFRYNPGDIDPTWANTTDIDIVAMAGWMAERLPLAGVNATDYTAQVAFRADQSRFWTPDRAYYVENVKEALGQPGQWYLDGPNQTVTYLPLDGEDIGRTEILAPVTTQLLELDGCHDMSFNGIAFAHTDWRHAKYEDGDWRIPQGGTLVEPAVNVVRSRGVSFSGCTFSSLGAGAVAIGIDCEAVAVQRCRFESIGGFGVKVSSDSAAPATQGRISTHDIIIEDCTLIGGGLVFHNACAVLAQDVHTVRIRHNEISDFFYTGISLGWFWSLADTGVRDNLVEANLVHRIGHGLLADLGGIYTLGRQPGTLIQGNMVSQVSAYDKPCPGVYFDQGSAMIVCRANVIHHNGQGIWAPNLVSGLDVSHNIVSDNRDFQLGTGGGSAPESADAPTQEVSFTHNVVTTAGRRLFGPESAGIISNENLLWDFAGDISSAADRMTTMSILDVAYSKVVTSVSGDFTGDGESFVFHPLPAPVQLEPGRQYHITISVRPHGPMWRTASRIATTEVARVIGDVQGAAGQLTVSSQRSTALGPVNFRYVAGDKNPSFIQHAQFRGTTQRNNFDGEIGMSIVVGPDPLQVTALGVLGLQSFWWRDWQRAGRDAHSVIADPQFLDRGHGDYTLAPGSPALRPPIGIQVNTQNAGPRPS